MLLWVFIISKKPKDNRNIIAKMIFPKIDANTKFKDHRERFRFFGRLYKQPSIYSFIYISVIGLIILMIPLVVYLINSTKFHSTLDGWAFWISGFVVTVLFEQVANYRYKSFSKIANKKSIDRVLRNIQINKGLRLIGMLGFILCVFAVAIMVVSSNGTIAEIWT